MDCILMIFLLNGIVSISSQCQFIADEGNVTFDFTKIYEMGVIVIGDSENSKWRYHLRVCGNLSNDCTSHYPGPGCSQLFESGSECSYYLANWDNNKAQSGIHLINISNPSQGISFEFNNGELCEKKDGQQFLYRSKYKFVCNKAIKFQGKGHRNSDDECLFEYELVSQSICPGYIPPNSTDTNSNSFSYGYIAIICFGILIFSAFILYYITLGINNKDWGIQSMRPLLYLCKLFCIYTFIGCKVSYQWITVNVRHRKDTQNGELMDTADYNERVL